MFSGKACYLNIVAAFSIVGSTSAATLVQSDGTFISFNAELGALDDDPSNSSKFDVMAPNGGSFGNYLSVESTPGTVSFDVDFLDNEDYTVYERYRELVNNTPQISLTFDGATKTSQVFETPSTTFAWAHLTNSDFTASGATPGLVQTVTLSAAGGISFAIDAVALVNRSAILVGGFIASDITIPESSLTVPEPSSSLLLLLGQLLIFRRRR